MLSTRPAAKMEEGTTRVNPSDLRKCGGPDSLHDTGHNQTEPRHDNPSTGRLVAIGVRHPNDRVAVARWRLSPTLPLSAIGSRGLPPFW